MQPLVLVILDGFGLSPIFEGNGVFSSATPNFDQLLAYFPHAALHAAGEEVGLSWGEMGNSEVGHLNLGTGRIIAQDLTRIEKAISDETFFKNEALLEAFTRAKNENINLHLIGLVSSGGAHSHISHLFALLSMAEKIGINNLYVHMITDGRDTPPKVALEDLKTLEAKFQELSVGKIASVGGRYYAMDRDKHWDRIELAYKAMFSESGPKASSAEEAISAAYNDQKTDEFILPVAIDQTPRIKENDTIIFFNFRSDRAKQLTDAIVNPDFKAFVRRPALKKFNFVSFTSYGFESTPEVNVAFFAEKVDNQLAKVISAADLKQIHLAETEKFAHVTYFFNGGVEKEMAGETRVLVPSPKVATYDLKPQMSAMEVAKEFVEHFKAEKPHFCVINLANPDMVGHTGDFEATKVAVTTADAALGMISNAVLSSGGNLLVTADHGNAEQMINPETREIDKEHTTNPVPLILAFPEKRSPQPLAINNDYKMQFAAMPPIGVLADVTSTCLEMLALKQPAEISGQSLRSLL